MSTADPSDFDYLPDLLAEIAAYGGLKAALKIADAKGGTRAYFPSKPGEGHWLTELVGLETATAICDGLTVPGYGMEFLVPLGPVGLRQQTWKLMHAMIEAGFSKKEIATTIGVHQSTVQRHKNGQSGVLSRHTSRRAS